MPKCKENEIMEEKYNKEKNNIDKAMGAIHRCIPFAENVSANRLHMVGTHMDHCIMLNEPDFPKVFTGYEGEFCRFLSSREIADDDYTILKRIEKYKNHKGFEYILILKNKHTDQIDVKSFKKFNELSEGNGYKSCETELDTNPFKSDIKKGELLKYANSYDKEKEAYVYGSNAKVVYMTLPSTIEDAVVISESYAKRNSFTKIDEVEVVINGNDMLGNTYGTFNNFKSFPDIGEKLKGNILLSKEKYDSKSAITNLTNNYFNEFNINKENYILDGDGYLVGYKIYVNGLDYLEKDSNYGFRKQVKEFYLDEKRYHEEIIKELKKHNKKYLTDKANHQLYDSSNFVDPNIKNFNFSNGTGKFEFACIKFYVARNTRLRIGNKLTNRYGGKSIISQIYPDYLMPKDIFGNVSDIIVSPSTIIKRANIAQNFEHEVNFQSFIIQSRLKSIKSLNEKKKLFLSFIKDLNVSYWEIIKSELNSETMTTDKLSKYFDDVEKKGIYLYFKPYDIEENTLSIEKLNFIYKKYDIKPYPIIINNRVKIGKENIESIFNIETKMGILDNLIEYALEFNKDNYKNIFDYQGMFKADGSLNIKKEDIEKQGTTFLDLMDSFNVSNILKDYKENGFIDKEKGSVYIDTINTYFNSEKEYIKMFNPDNISFIKDSKLVLEGRGKCIGMYVDPKDSDYVIFTYISEKDIIISDIQYIVLKQFPEDKASSRAIGTSNLLKLPCKNENNYTKIESNPALHLGEMELQNLNRAVGDKEKHLIGKFLEMNSTNNTLSSATYNHLMRSNPFENHVIVNNKDYADIVGHSNSVEAYNALNLALGVETLFEGEKDSFEDFDNRHFVDVDDMINEFEKKNRKRKRGV